MRKYLSILAGFALLSATVIITAQTPLTNALNLRVRTDSNGYLIVSSGTYTSPDSPLTALANTRLRTDSNGYLIVTSSGGGGFATLGANTFTDTQTIQTTNTSLILKNGANTRFQVDSGGNITACPTSDCIIDVTGSNAVLRFTSGGRLRSSCVTPGTLTNGDQWMESSAGNCTTTTAGTVLSVKMYHGSGTRTISTFTY